ncbi:MAG: mechanosensitive ion channel protein MscS [Bacteroidetes bacterium 4572_112]|nr:MAG: mechanosensitive ion channel protein MscS [Bacteroidetes bacterium 4572_112]
MEDVDKYSGHAIEFVMNYGPKLIGAILVLFIGLKIVKIVSNTTKRVMNARGMDASLIPFLSGIVNMLLKTLLMISVMSMIGIEMTSFVALLGAAGLAVGMALSGTLQNFAGGVMILIFKPYKSGDFIEAQGYMGVVSHIDIFNTILMTVDNKKIILPNGPLSTSSLTNYSAEATRRVDFSFGIGYGDDIDQARDVIMQEIGKLPQILRDVKGKEPMVVVGELGDSSVNLTTRVWVNSADYWDVNFAMLEGVKKAFDKNNISIPFPQTDVHLFQEK